MVRMTRILKSLIEITLEDVHFDLCHPCHPWSTDSVRLRPCRAGFRPWLFLLLLVVGGPITSADEPGDAAIRRSVALLAAEVPQWKTANGCYSCHNNGDAVRALVWAKRAGFAVPTESLKDSIEWLARPEKWKENGPDEEFNDRRLAAIQFSVALREARAASLVEEESSLKAAAELLAEVQQADGAWEIDASGSTGSPLTYGRFLATVLSRDVLRSADPERHKPRIARADEWLKNTEPKTVLDAAAVLIGLAGESDEAAISRRMQCLELVRKGENQGGGWGPYIMSQAEPFDTSLVVIALSKHPASDESAAMLARGRAWLIAAQLDDGSWLETTRPADRESYAHRISTAAWGTTALLATREPPRTGAADRRPPP
jgi:hypothetical protein